MKLPFKTTLTLLVGIALGTVGSAMAESRWQFLEPAEWLPQQGSPGAYVRTLKGKDQMRIESRDNDVTYSIKMDRGHACTVKLAKNTPITLMNFAPNGETYAANVGPEIIVGYTPPDAPLSVVLH